MESNSPSVRPTKKQRELLTFVSQFIAEHGYSPSYREIMNGLEYTSVATVSLHVQNLIKRGHLRKRDYSARSLEVVHPDTPATVTTNHIMPAEEKWFVDKIEHMIRQVEQTSATATGQQLRSLDILVEALNVLGLGSAAVSFRSRIVALKKRSM